MSNAPESTPNTPRDFGHDRIKTTLNVYGGMIAEIWEGDSFECSDDCPEDCEADHQGEA